MAAGKRVSPEIKSEAESFDKKPLLATKERAQSTTPTHLSLQCTAQGCNKVFQAATHRLARKALMRHLFRFQKAGSEVSEDSQDSDLTRKQISDRAHHLAYKVEVLSYRTSKEKQLASRAKYKEANKEKVARASRISNYRAQAKKIPDIMGQGMEAVYKWAEDKEEERKDKEEKRGYKEEERKDKEEKRKYNEEERKDKEEERKDKEEKRKYKEEERKERSIKEEPA